MPNLTLSPDSSRLLYQGALKTILNKHEEKDAVVEIILKNAAGQLLSRRLFYGVPPKKLDLPQAKITVKAQAVNDGYELTLHGDRLAKNVLLQTTADGMFSDNYFDLLPGERKTVIFKTKSVLDAPQTAFKARSLVDTY